MFHHGQQGDGAEEIILKGQLGRGVQAESVPVNVKPLTVLARGELVHSEFLPKDGMRKEVGIRAAANVEDASLAQFGGDEAVGALGTQAGEQRFEQTLAAREALR